ncbi:MAG TPA: RNA polymerase subunit sigma-70 [Polyangiales bacterium]
MVHDLIARARAGDAAAFQQLTEPHRRELRVHCYRMLGSVQDAEDVLQETLLAAWQGLERFEGRASIRVWLYKIATHRCLNERRSRERRPARAYDVPGVQVPEPTGMGEIAWLEPFPSTLLEPAPDPARRYDQLETISLTFVTALQSLPRRPLAVLILCDILEFGASEVAARLGVTLDSVHSALKRARAKLKHRHRQGIDHHPAWDASDSLSQQFARAWESADVDTVVALLTDDVFISMPPFPNEYQGRELAARFCASIFAAGRRFALLPTSANGQPAFGVYLRSDSAVAHGVGLYVLTVRGDRICAMTRFEHHVLPWFGLPPSISRT